MGNASHFVLGCDALERWQCEQVHFHDEASDQCFAISQDIFT
jgi:hypothetical protein